MRAISTTEISRLRTSQQETFLDACKIGTVSETTTGTYITRSASWGTETPCGFEPGGRRETKDGAQAVIGDAVVRVAAGTSVSNQNLIQITKRFGTTLSAAETFAIIGEPAVGPSCIVLTLQRLPGNAVG